ncbi:hypothetical protein PLCT2_00671 [Planctomycetaceae bacterium]|nr:hypothetical protein PLCT2_00671 [Planctomycetaceae bacterium]
MKPLGILGALIGGCLGAFVWGLGAGGPHGFEGYNIAILVGLLVGVGCVLLNGRGVKTALLCCAVSVLSVFAGKAFACWLVLNRDWSYSDRLPIQAAAEREHPFNQEAYSNLLKNVGAFAALTGPEDYPRFIIERGFEDDPVDGEVSEVELDAFNKWWAPLLVRWKKDLPRFKEAREDYLETLSRAEEERFKSTHTMIDLFKTWSYHPLDILFLALALIIPVVIVETVTERERMKREAAERLARQAAERKPLPKLAPAKPR